MKQGTGDGGWGLEQGFPTPYPPAPIPRPSFRLRRFLPYLTALIRRAHHWVALFALEGGGELLHVRERAVDAEARGRMRVGDDAPPGLFRPDGAGPDLRPTEEETLFRREAVNQLRRSVSLR